MTFRSSFLCGLFILMTPGFALAQDATMKACGEKWQAAKAAGTADGSTWPKFLAECRAGRVGELAPSALPPARAAQTVTPTTQEKPVAQARQGEPIFPKAVSAKFAELRPSDARRKTCSEQYQANKASDANGGLRWLEKGGGYWSLCNTKLKG
jgi:hypothetical protein